MVRPAAIPQSVFSLRDGEGLRVNDDTLVVSRIGDGHGDVQIGGCEVRMCEPGEKISLGPVTFLVQQLSDDGRRRLVLRVDDAPREVAICVLSRGEVLARTTGV